MDTETITTTCVQCGRDLSEKRLAKKAKFCGDTCRIERNQKEWRKRNPGAKIPTPTVGTIAELLVCTDLLSRGAAVFRALSPSCPCDVACLVDNKLYRVEVTSGYIGAGGKISYSKHDPQKYDIIAIVLKGQDIVYIPPIEDIVGKPDPERYE